MNIESRTVDHHHQHWAPVVPRGWARPRYAATKLAYLVFPFAISCRSSICPGRISAAWLVSHIALSCRMVYVVARDAHRSSLRRLIFPTQDHFSFLTLLIIPMTCALSLTLTLVILSLYVMLSILLFTLIIMCLLGECPGLYPICHSWQHT